MVSNSIFEKDLVMLDARKNGQVTLVRRYEFMVKVDEAELEKLQLQRSQYEITAPVTGTVITRESEIRQLLSRPVQQGEAVLEVVPDDTGWEFTVNITEDEAGELLKAYKDRQEAYRTENTQEYMRARLILNAYPDMIFHTRVLSVAPRAYVLTTGKQQYRNVISVRVAGPKEMLDKIDPRGGMEGKVAIECGRRSLFYALTHEFVDFVRVSMF